MMKGFTKRQLMDQCGFTDEESKMILTYQKKLPVLTEDADGFCVSARDLWVQLGEPQGRFADWVKRKLTTKKSKGGILIFVEGLDYKSFSQKCEKVMGRPTKEYYLTVGCAKDLSMMENTDSGEMARRYFKLMEQAVKRHVEWTLVREPMKQGYKDLCEAINLWMNRCVQRDADDWDYRIEADALNVIATGFRAQEIRNFVGCLDNHTRDSLTITYNEYLMKLQEWDIMFLGMNMNRYERYEKLREAFNIFYPNAITIKNDVSIIEIQKNKQRVIDEAKSKITDVA